MDLPPLSANTGPNDASSSAKLWAVPILKEPVSFYIVFTQMPGVFCGPGCIDDLRYAARAALRFTPEELDDEMYRAVHGGAGVPTWETFKPLVAYHRACAVALMPLIDLGPPPADVVRGYSWTWRTCPMCARHSGRGVCELFCADAPWFVELWRELVAILRARPDPDAVLTWGKDHFARALKEAMECPFCSEVAEE